MDFDEILKIVGRQWIDHLVMIDRLQKQVAKLTQELNAAKGEETSG